MWMVESDIGVSVAVTRQKAGRPVRILGGLEFGTVKVPVVLSSADVMVACCSCTNFRLVHGVAGAGIYDPADEVEQVFTPLLDKWEIFTRCDFGPAGELARDELADFIKN